MTVFPAISYDHPNQSHFTSRHFYEVGALDPAGTTGWLGRWLDLRRRPGQQPDPGPEPRRPALPGARDRARRGRRGDVAVGLRLPEPGRLRQLRRERDGVGLRPARQPGHDRPDPAPGAPGAAQRRAAARPARDAARRPRRSPTRRTTASPTTCAASRCCSRPACRSAPARSRATAASTRTPTRSPASATTCSPTATRSRPTRRTSRPRASPTAS